MTRTALVVGSGIGGLTTAIALRARGVDVRICEASDGLRQTGTGLGLASNATKVLAALGVDIGHDDRAAVCSRFELRTARGSLIRAVPVDEITAQLGHPVVQIHRNELMRTLRDAADDTPVDLGARVVDFWIDDNRAHARCADGRTYDADVLIGADGIRSVIRSKLDRCAEPVDHGYICWLATIASSRLRLEPGYMCHYWGPGQRFGLIDIGGGMTYWWGTKNMPPAQARNWRGGTADIAAAFTGWAPEVVSAIEDTSDEEIVAVPAQDRPFLRRWGRGPITLLGDAAHPMLTSLGQGACAAIEDAYVLAEALARIADPVAALRKYEDLRRGRTRRLVRWSRRLSHLEQTPSRLRGSLRDFGLRRAPTWVMTHQSVRPMRFELAWPS